ncbi:Ribose-5-phosphate isomerase A [uncultured archaeon]|nr:Ribose-5-phosphate isomerase A [uncultured archaeon]
MAQQQESEKKAAAEAALKYIEDGMKVGLGSGTTSGYFIEALAKSKKDVVCVASGGDTEKKAKALKLKVIPFQQAQELDVYVDGADEADKKFNLIKGGGGCLTREKVLASASYQFICIIDSSKQVPKIGAYPLPIEVISFAKEYVTRELTELEAEVTERKGYTTDNGNIILDVKNLDFADPLQLETELNNIPGVLENGIFSVRQPDIILIAKGKVVETLNNKG